MARGELHIQLSVDYFDDEKFAEVSRSARLLYVDALCMAKRLLNDGTVTRAQLDKLMYPAKGAAAKKAAAELVDAGLWRWEEQRRIFLITAWLKRNKSRSQVEQDRRDAEEAAALGNHRRWHEARNARDPKCGHCRDNPIPPSSGIRSGTRSDGGSGARHRSDSPETETETETKNKEPVPVLHRAHLTPPEPPDSDGTAGPAEQLVTAWVGSCNRRPPSKVVDDVGRHVATMLRDGAPAGDITRGIEIWQAKGMHPNSLPSVVNQVMNAGTSNVVAIATRGTPRPSTTDQRVGAALALAEKFAQEDPA